MLTEEIELIKAFDEAALLNKLEVVKADVPSLELVEKATAYVSL